ncbi:MAG: hypothetical protein V5B39_17845 [Accumulibacter sp.]|jgi:hypothetical protein|uniref:lysine 5,6-aminomutase reactivase subunit KamB n=1 Tax=Accumulibacter sp. TaxID=2053492 RepID=UPI002FC2F96B
MGQQAFQLNRQAAMSTSALWHQVRERGLATLAVVGMTKNTGKTVALNHLLACAAEDGVAIGVTSIGRDGENRDQVFFFPKPPVRVWSGSIIATARDTLLRAKVRWKLLAATGLDSPMGEIVIVRALDHGEMEIAGASRSSDQQKIIAQLRQCGCALIILDGALGRSQHASPAIADGIILATGAAIGGGVQDVIRKTRERLATLTIPQAGPEILARCQAVFESGGVGIWDCSGGPLFLADIATLSAGSTLLAFADREPGTIAVSGAVGKALWLTVDALLAQHPGLTLVVADGTKLFIEHADVQRFRQRGGKLLACRRIHIAGITLNPFSPHGRHLVAQDLLGAARLAFPEYEVGDVIFERVLTETGVC